MQFKLSICGVLLLAVAAAQGQVASHAPTVFKQAPAQNPAALSTKPVARVNGSLLTEADLLREEYAIFPYARQHNGTIPKDMEPQIRAGALKMIVFEELVYQEAVHRKIAVTPAKMQQARAEFRKQFTPPDQFNAFLQSEFHGSRTALDDKIRRSLLIEEFLRLEVEAKSVPTPADLRAFYDKNPARFEHPESYTFQTISILPPASPNPDQIKEGRKRAEQAIVQAKVTKTTEAFGLLAEKLSDDDFHVNLGQHKPVPASELAPQVLKALQSMQIGQVSDLIQLDQAFTIVRLQAHTPPGKQKFEDARKQLQKELQDTRRNQLRGSLDQKLRQAAKIEEM